VSGSTKLHINRGSLSDLFRLFRTCFDSFGLVSTLSDLFRLCWTCFDSIGLVSTLSDLFRLFRTCFDSFGLFRHLYRRKTPTIERYNEVRRPKSGFNRSIARNCTAFIVRRYVLSVTCFKAKVKAILPWSRRTWL